MAALQPLLAAVAVTPKAKLTGMLEALQVPGRRVVRHEPVQGMLADMFEAVMKEAKPVMDKLQEQLVAHQQAAAGGDKVPAAGGASVVPDAGVSSAPGGHGDGVTGGVDGASQGTAGSHAGAASTQGDHDSHVAGFNPPEAEDFSLLLHRILLCTAFNFERSAAFKEAAELAGQRLAVGAVGSGDEGQVAVFRSVYHILTALSELEAAPGG
jgi:hypothetical protein